MFWLPHADTSTVVLAAAPPIFSLDRDVRAAFDIAQSIEQGGETLLLYAWEGLSYTEVADAVGVPVGTVRSRIHRARNVLRGALDMNLEESR